MPTFGSLFSGIGGCDLGLERAGWRCAWQVEIDPFCQRVLAIRWPDVPRWRDVRSFQSGTFSEPRSRRHAEALLEAGHDRGRPAWPDGEQGAIDLLVGGFPCQDLSVAGKRVGLDGERSGLFWEIIRIAKILTPTWGLVENVPGLVSSHRGRDMETVVAGLRECWPAVGYRILDSQHFGVPQRRRRVFFGCGPTDAGVAQVLALTEGGGRDSPAGGQAGAGIAGPLGGGAYGIDRRDEDDPNLILVSETLNSGGNSGGFRTEPGDLLAFTERTRADGRNVEWQEEQAYSLMNPGAGGRTQENGIATMGMVRRLTPVECERLQGFPDGWTCLCQPLAAYAADPDAAALACTCPDSPRYRALGNAVTVNVIKWLGRRFPA